MPRRSSAPSLRHRDAHRDCPRRSSAEDRGPPHGLQPFAPSAPCGQPQPAGRAACQPMSSDAPFRLPSVPCGFRGSCRAGSWRARAVRPVRVRRVYRRFGSSNRRPARMHDPAIGYRSSPCRRRGRIGCAANPWHAVDILSSGLPAPAIHPRALGASRRGQVAATDGG